MASTISPPTFLCSSAQKKSTSSFTISSSLVLYPKTSKLHLSTSIPQLGLTPWSGLKHMGISVRPQTFKLGRKRKIRGKVVYASLFGVGAPEALVIGVVALLVFGPKGLAEVAKNLGKTLRAFQPTIRELQEVSREFKSTLEREIGLDDLPPSAQNNYRSTNATTTPPTSSTAPSAVESSPDVVDPNGAEPAEPPLNLGEFLVNANIKSNIAQKEKEAALKEEQEQSESQPQPQQTTAPEATATIPEVTAAAPEVIAATPPSETVEKIENEITLPSDKKENEVSSSTN
ncbi:sec-independent protein translocase protein TATB, chloroplastic-like isoform X2 [Papaver somniferum]|uniref:sec-independent protein translocase protein TATB, chloroplastic-like isoform X2 n=1 Tax=Papaver somniferum TaxID=3469 RepID=UPI000E6F4D56|nr:sec-independent protein translocase protein TATB, chloroplastic-like isoform X2 [Papaver somniferum]